MRAVTAHSPFQYEIKDQFYTENRGGIGVFSLIP